MVKSFVIWNKRLSRTNNRYTIRALSQVEGEGGISHPRLSMWNNVVLNSYFVTNISGGGNLYVTNNTLLHHLVCITPSCPLSSCNWALSCSIRATPPPPPPASQKFGLKAEKEPNKIQSQADFTKSQKLVSNNFSLSALCCIAGLQPKDIFSLLQSLFHVENAGNSYSELATLPPPPPIPTWPWALPYWPALLSLSHKNNASIPPSPPPGRGRGWRESPKSRHSRTNKAVGAHVQLWKSIE